MTISKALHRRDKAAAGTVLAAVIGTTAPDLPKGPRA